MKPPALQGVRIGDDVHSGEELGTRPAPKIIIVATSGEERSRVRGQPAWFLARDPWRFPSSSSEIYLTRNSHPEFGGDVHLNKEVGIVTRNELARSPSIAAPSSSPSHM